MNRFRPAELAAPLVSIGVVMTMLALMLTPAPAPANYVNPAVPPDKELPGPPTRGNVAQYFIDRGNDLLDIVRIRVGVPHKAHAFGAKARVTSLVQLGFVWFEGSQYGMDRRAVGQWHEGRTEGGVSLLYFSNVQNESGWGNRYLKRGDPWSTFQSRGVVRNNLFWDDGRRHPLSIGAEVQLGIIPGLDLGVYPGEALDFLGGIFTLDYWDDDYLHVNRNLRRLEKMKADAVAEMAADKKSGAEAMAAYDGSVATEQSPDVEMEQIETYEAPYSDDVLPETIDTNETQPIQLAPEVEAAPAPAVEAAPVEPAVEEAKPETPAVNTAPKERPTETKRTKLQEQTKPEPISTEESKNESGEATVTPHVEVEQRVPGIQPDGSYWDETRGHITADESPEDDKDVVNDRDAADDQDAQEQTEELPK